MIDTKKIAKITVIVGLGLGALALQPKSAKASLPAMTDPLVAMGQDLVSISTLVTGAEWIGASILAFVTGATIVKHIATK